MNRFTLRLETLDGRDMPSAVMPDMPGMNTAALHAEHSLSDESISINVMSGASGGVTKSGLSGGALMGAASGGVTQGVEPGGALMGVGPGGTEELPQRSTGLTGQRTGEEMPAIMGMVPPRGGEEIPTEVDPI